MNRPQIYTEFISDTTVGTNPESKRAGMGLEAGSQKLVSTLHKVDFVVAESLSITPISFSWVLRKNSKEIASVYVLDEDSAIACGGRFSYAFVNSGAAAAGPDKFNAPTLGQIDFVRPGRFWVQCSGAGIGWAVFLYYSLREASGDEITKLLVKNHA